MARGRNGTRATLVEGERSRHCTIPAPHYAAEDGNNIISKYSFISKFILKRKPSRIRGSINNNVVNKLVVAM